MGPPLFARAFISLPDEEMIGHVSRLLPDGVFVVKVDSTGVELYSTTFYLLAIKIQFVHPNVGAAAEILIPNTDRWVSCIVKELREPEPEVLLEACDTGIIPAPLFESSTFEATKISFKYARPAAQGDENGNMIGAPPIGTEMEILILGTWRAGKIIEHQGTSHYVVEVPNIGRLFSQSFQLLQYQTRVKRPDVGAKVIVHLASGDRQCDVIEHSNKNDGFILVSSTDSNMRFDSQALLALGIKTTVVGTEENVEQAEIPMKQENDVVDFPNPPSPLPSPSPKKRKSRRILESDDDAGYEDNDGYSSQDAIKPAPKKKPCVEPAKKGNKRNSGASETTKKATGKNKEAEVLPPPKAIVIIVSEEEEVQRSNQDEKLAGIRKRVIETFRRGLSSTAPEGEMKRAMALGRRLVQKYNLDEMEMIKASKEVEKVQESGQIDLKIVKNDGKMQNKYPHHDWMHILAYAVCANYSIDCTYCPASRGISCPTAFTFFGLVNNLRLAADSFRAVFDHVHRLALNYKYCRKKHGRRSERQVRTSYALGIAHSLEEIGLMQRNRIQRSVKCRALIARSQSAIDIEKMKLGVDEAPQDDVMNEFKVVKKAHKDGCKDSYKVRIEPSG